VPSAYLALSLAAALIPVPRAATAEPIGFRVESRWPGYTRGAIDALSVAGEHAFLVSYNGLFIVDLSEPLRPRRVGTLELNGASDVAVEAPYAYIAGSEGVWVVDITVPSNPRLAGRLALPSTATGLAVDGPLLVVGTRLNGVAVADIRDPRSPRVLVFLPPQTEEFRDVALEGSVVYVAYARRVEVYDLSIPELPEALSTLWTTEPWRVSVDGGRLSVTFSSGFLLVDCIDPRAPKSLGSHIADRSRRAVCSGNIAFIATQDLLHIVDMKDPAHPAERSVKWAGQALTDIAVRGSQVLLAGGLGLQIMDASDLTKPTLVGFDDSGVSVDNLEVADNVVYLSSVQDGVDCIDISEFRKPARLGGYRQPVDFYARYLCLQSNLVYAAGMGSRILDFADPLQPLTLNDYDWVAERVFDVTWQGGLEGSQGRPVAVTGSRYALGLQVDDITDPSAPQSLGGVSTDDGTVGIDISGDLAFVAARNAGVYVVDLRDPEAPRIRDHLMLDVPCWGIRVRGDRAYVALEEYGCSILDIRDPDHLVEWCRYVEFTETEFGSGYFQPFYQADAVGNHVFLAGSPRTLTVIDVSDPSQPVRVGTYSSGETSRDLRVVGDKVYLAEGYRGFTVLTWFVRPQLDPPKVVDGQLNLSWSGGPRIVLQSCSSLALSQWQDVPETDGMSQYSLSPAESTSFFRVVKQSD
jgi:hypothetical protein